MNSKFESTTRLAGIIAGCALAMLSTNAMAGVPVPDIGVTTTPGSEYIIVGADVTVQDIFRTSEFLYNEESYTPGSSVTITDRTGYPITLSDVGYYISPTEIPLGDLNTYSETQVSSSYDIMLPDNGSETIPLPAPDAGSTMTLTGMALFALGFVGRRMGTRK